MSRFHDMHVHGNISLGGEELGRSIILCRVFFEKKIGIFFHVSLLTYVGILPYIFSKSALNFKTIVPQGKVGEYRVGASGS